MKKNRIAVTLTAHALTILVAAVFIAAGAFAAVGGVTWMAVKLETTFVDVAAVVAVALWGMARGMRILVWVSGKVLPKAMTWLVLEIAGRRAKRAGSAAASTTWLARPPCEGIYRVEWPWQRRARALIEVVRDLPHDGLFMRRDGGLVPIDDLVKEGARFDGPLPPD